MELTLGLAAIIAFSAMAFWIQNAPLFMITANISIMVGLQWFNVYTDNTGMAISLMLIIYSFTCCGFAFRCIFWKEPPAVEAGG